MVIFVAREIITMDPTWPEAKMVAIQDGRILGIGEKIEDFSPWINRPSVTHSVDETFKDLVLSPGFIEQHNHPLIGGTALSVECISYAPIPTPFGKEHPGCKTKAEVMRKLREASDKLPAGETLIAWGWDSVALGGHLNRRDLDSISNNRVILVWDCSLHFGYCNSAGIAKAKLNVAGARSIPGVGIGADGELDGSFLGVAAMRLIMKLFAPLMEPARALKSLHYITELGRQGGITTMAELMQGSVSLPLEGVLYKHFYQNPTTPMRCIVVFDSKNLLAGCFGSIRWATSWLRNMQRRSTEKLIFNNGIKFFTDDAFLGLSMCLSYPGYTDGRQGLWQCGKPGAAYAAKMLPWWKAGCRIHVHSNGDAAQEATAEALSVLQTAFPRFDHRFCVEHYGMSALHLHRRLKNLGASVAFNGYYPYLRGSLNVKYLGTDRSLAASRLRSAVDVGLPVAMHTDTPVAPPRPLEEIWIAVNRMSDEGAPLCKDEAVTAYQALKMKTVDAAYVHGLDGLLGSIEAGKLADFTVLDRNPLTVPQHEIRSIKVWGTVVGGTKYPAKPQALKVPVPPPGLLGPLFWLFSQNAQGKFQRNFWGFLAKVAGCKADEAAEEMRRFDDDAVVV